MEKREKSYKTPFARLGSSIGGMVKEVPRPPDLECPLEEALAFSLCPKITE